MFSFGDSSGSSQNCQEPVYHRLINRITMLNKSICSLIIPALFLVSIQKTNAGINKKNFAMDTTLNLPVGFHKFCKVDFVNYRMLNLLYSLGHTSYEETLEIGNQIKKIKDAPSVFIKYAHKAEKEKRFRNAAAWYRAAEFYTPPELPERSEYYNKFSENISKAFENENFTRHQVPYGNSYLSAFTVEPETKECKGTVLIHGGFDSFIEIFYAFAKRYAMAGYKVIAFDGPGQGASLMKYNVPITHEWEKPVGAVLDYFKEDSAILHGFSFGGYWCVRAAAFEKRIVKLVVHAPFYDYMEIAPKPVQKMIRWMAKRDGLMNASVKIRTRLIPLIKHVEQQVRHITLQYDAPPKLSAGFLLDMNKEFLHSELVNQDVLLLAGEKDSFQPLRLHYKQKEALVNAKSVTERIFTKEEHAASHCQIGNVNLLMDEIINWLAH